MNEKTDTCPDCSNIPCDCGMPAGYAPTPTPWTDANEEDGWNPCGWAVDSNLVRELERELTAVTEQRDELLRYNEAFRKDALICADCDAITKKEYDRAIEQRDKYQDIASELIAMIRINVMRDTFKTATTEQVNEYLKQWIERIAAVKGGNDES